MSINLKCEKNPYSCILLDEHIFYALYNVHVYTYIHILTEIQRKKPVTLETTLKFLGDFALLF